MLRMLTYVCEFSVLEYLEVMLRAEFLQAFDDRPVEVLDHVHMGLEGYVAESNMHSRRLLCECLP